MKRPHFALPEIYDDSLSYYDVLRKLIKSMHVISDNLNKIPEQIANEAKARLLGDQNLQQNINSEATTREQGDTALQQNINSEATTREQADQEIREDVSDKISELKGDLANKLDKANERVYIGSIVDKKWQQSNGNEYDATYGFYLSANVQPNTKYYVSGVIINGSFPLIVMFDENNNAIGAKETSGNITPINDYEFIPPSNCVKISVNGRKGTNHPSLYYIQNKDLNGNDFYSLINNKQNQIAEWEKADYEYETNKFVKIKSNEIEIVSSSVAGGYNYAKLIYDKNKKYRFFGQCNTSAIPTLICCDEIDKVLKIYDNEVGTVLKGKEYDDIPPNTYCIYVNGHNLNARVEIKEQRNTTSFESKKIGVCFGDSITQGNNVYISSSITPINDYPSVVGKTLDCTVYNGGLGGSTYSSGRSIDFKNVCDCVVSGDFSTVIDGISQYGLNASAVLQYNAISELNFNDVDFVSIALGTNDWNFGASAEGIKNAMRYCISTLLTAYPHLKIYVFTPIYRFNLGGSGQDSDTYVNTASGLKLHDVCDAIIETAKEFNIPCKDMYYCCNINQYNKELYMGDDTHPNANGYALMGEKIAKFINSN